MGNRLTEAFRRLRGGSAEPGAGGEQGADVSPQDRRIIERVFPYTMTGWGGAERIAALTAAVRYCVRRDVPGDLAECGVWRGGSVLAMILALQELGVSDRDIHLYDTFTGMTKPTEHDTSDLSAPPIELWDSTQERIPDWDTVFGPEAFSEEATREVVLSTGYPEERLHFVRGPVEETLPSSAPERLSLLRVDTDWYESTRHELVHLYPRLAVGGVLIIDDYGAWDGCRRAVDEYFGSDAEPVLLTRIDADARLAVKTG